MRRPVIFTAAAFGGGIAAAYLTEVSNVYWIIMFLNAVALFLWQRSQRRRLFSLCCIFLCIFSVGAGWMDYSEEKVDPLVLQAGSRTQVTGLVTSIKEKEDSLQLVVKSGKSRILVNYYGKYQRPEELAGRWILAAGELALPQCQRNPGCFDYRLYLRTCGIQTVMTAEVVNPADGPRDRYRKIVYDIRSHFGKKLEALVPAEIKGIVMAMLFGDKSSLDENLYEDFQKNGTAHILAVSGLHVGILYGFLTFLWRGRKSFLFYIIILTALLLYTALADFSPSVVRAAVMITLHLLANALHRRYDLLSAAAFTFLLMLCMEPFQLLHVGFQLSFLAVASLGVILPFVQRMYQGIFLPAIAIQAGMLPYTAYVFNYVSLGAFFVNIPIVFLAGILLPAGISLVVVSYLSDTVFAMGTAFLEQGCRLLIFLNQLVYAEGKTSFDVTSPPIFLLVVYYGLLFLGVSEKGRILMIRKKWKRLAAGALIVAGIAGIAATGFETDFSKAGIVFVDVGQGDCIHVRTREGRNFLIDGGGSLRYDVGKKTLKPYLLKNGVQKLDGAFVTHLHQDHYDGIRSLAQQGMVEKLGVYEGNRVLEKQLKKEIGMGTELLYLYKGQQVQLGEGVSLEIVYPERKSQQEYEALVGNQEDENAFSLIMKLQYEELSVLITGDIDEQGEAQLVELYKGDVALQADILKIAHHGSKYSSSDLFLDVIRAKTAVFQVGKNNFGHPAQSVIENCRERGIMIYRNDTSGAIGIIREKGGRGISVQKMIE